MASRAHATLHPRIKHHENKRDCSFQTKGPNPYSVLQPAVKKVAYTTHLYGSSAFRVQTTSCGVCSVAPVRLSSKVTLFYEPLLVSIRKVYHGKGKENGEGDEDKACLWLYEPLNETALSILNATPHVS